jgi:putative transposase
MYRILAVNAQVKDRRRLTRHLARARPELIATGPGQVFTGDIAKLPGPARGVYYDAHVMIEIYSRYVVGAHAHVTETAVLAEEMMREVFTIHRIPQVVHADRGTSMTSKPLQRCSPISVSPGLIHDPGCPTTTPFPRRGSRL